MIRIPNGRFANDGPKMARLIEAIGGVLQTAAEQHEAEDHGGILCGRYRANLVAALAYGLGLGPRNMATVGFMLAEYLNDEMRDDSEGYTHDGDDS